MANMNEKELLQELRKSCHENYFDMATEEDIECIMKEQNLDRIGAIKWAIKFTKELKNEFYRVSNTGGSYDVATFFNPITKEEFSRCIYDYDDVRVQQEEAEYREIPFSEKVRRIWLHHKGIIQVGDLVKINRGRKFKGKQKRVVKKLVYKYVWGDVIYLVFEDGTKVAQDNCDLIKEYSRYGYVE